WPQGLGNHLRIHCLARAVHKSGLIAYEARRRSTKAQFQLAGCLLTLDLQVKPIRSGQWVEGTVRFVRQWLLWSRSQHIQQARRFDLALRIDELHFDVVFRGIGGELALDEVDAPNSALEEPRQLIGGDSNADARAADGRHRDSNEVAYLIDHWPA